MKFFALFLRLLKTCTFKGRVNTTDEAKKRLLDLEPNYIAIALPPTYEPSRKSASSSVARLSP